MQFAPHVNICAANGRRLYKAHEALARRLLMDGLAFHRGKPDQIIRVLELGVSAEPSGPPSDVFAARPTFAVSHKIQNKGAKRWVVRLDRADSGLTASHRRIVSPIAHPHRRYAVGKAEQPQEQFA